ncbi:MAG: carboxypeptidase-like regulatory domain-containing protein [Paludibacteraceae bacterium]
MKKRLKLLCILFFIGIGVSFAQTRVTGSVKDENGEPIIGASVMVKGTNVGISTDANGLFTLIVPGNASTLVFSYVGMNSLELPVRPQMDVLLRSNAELLEEVVVVG